MADATRRTDEAAWREWTLRCEVVYLRALLAVGARNQLGDSEPAARYRERLAGAEAELAGIAGRGPMARLAQRLRLTPLQIELLWAAAAVTADPRLGAHAEALVGATARHGLSVALFAELVEPDPRDAMALALWLVRGDNPLTSAGMLIAGDPATVPAAQPFRVPARVLSYLAGELAPDAALDVVEARPGPIFDEPQQRALAQLRELLVGAGTDVIVVVEGQGGSGRRTAVALALARPLLVLDGARHAREDAAAGLLALRREVALTGGVPVIADAERFTGDERAVEALGRALDRWSGPLVITTTTPSLHVGTSRSVVRVRWPIAGPEVRRRLWEAEAGGAAPAGDLELLAHRFRVGPGVVRRAAISARALAGRAPVTAGHLAAGLRHNIAEWLTGLAVRVDVTQRWDDLVVADDTRQQIHTLIARVRHAPRVLDGWGFRSKIARGTGVAALFSGPPGTGKTMTAGLIARELDLDVYQVDLSNVVSKWIGETEKHLARVFDAAEQGHALLLFDEADALFGQRTTEVRGATDRYANLEVNYLLQRVEAFGGITVLTTNLDRAIDPALRRRLAAHIVFDLPDEDERAAIWKRTLATGAAPIDRDVEPEELARIFAKMSGANIRNAAIAAAFLAAAEGAPRIAMAHLVRAGRVEYRAMGHVLADRGSLGAP